MRIETALRELPDVIDLMRVGVDAGMSPSRALGDVSLRFDGPFARELRVVSAELALGGSIDQSLERLTNCFPAAPVKTFVASFRSAVRQGTELGPTLARLAAATRHARHQKLREQAARAGPKIQLIVALIAVPSVLLVIAAALVTQVSNSGITGL
jgi:tight adherence protein C